MRNNVFSSSGLPIRRSVDLLPKVFQTTPNSKFLDAIVDPLIQPGSLEKLYGYVGRKYGKTYSSSDVYLDNEETLRSKYQLEPGVVIQNDGKISNFYDYIDFKNQLKFFENSIDNDDLITTDEHYAWAPPIDWDKFVNFREYYWLPDGPLPVDVAGELTQEVQTTYTVRTSGSSEWVFSPDGLKKNPSINLYRGKTYEFEINSPGDPFFIRTSSTQGSSSNYNKGVTNNGTENGKITFTVPYDSPDLLYYQSARENDRVGSFRIYDIASTARIDIVESIIGAKEFKSANNVVFTNGLKVKFTGTVTPKKYSEGYWYVEGVGEAIRLVSVQDLELPILNTTNPEVLFDNDPFDTIPFDDATSYPTQKDYVTINRSSIDNNSWSRYNRWFHRSVIDYSNSINQISFTLSETARAKRPIIEFKKDIQLFNHGAVAKQSIDLIDNFTTDVFTTVEGQANYNIDGVDLFDGARVLFTKDSDSLVKNKIYQVRILNLQNSPIFDTIASQTVVDGQVRDTILGIRRQISLIEVDDTDPQSGECVYIKLGKNKGNMYHFTGTEWILSQRKSSVQQSPLFDCFDNDEVSFSDLDKYPVSNFKGTKIVSYKEGTGRTDTELNFKLSYLNIENVGDIQFNFDFDIDKFTWQKSLRETITQEVNSGFFRFNDNISDFTFKNGWQIVDNTFLQPVVEAIKINETTKTVDLTTIYWKESTKEKTILYKNGKFLRSGWKLEQKSNNPNLKVLYFDNNLVSGDIITVKIYTDARPDTGYYEIPMGLEKNPLNSDLETFTLGQITDHLGTIFEIDDRLVGDFPGISNLKDIAGVEIFGRRFVKHSGLMPMAMTLLCNKDLNIVKSIRFAKSEYTKFKNNLVQLAVELPYDLNPINLLDQILDSLSTGKNENSPFYGSDMIGTGPTKEIKYTVEDTGIKVFALSEKFDLTIQSDKAVYVYINNEQQLVNKDYEFDGTFGFVRILKNLNEGDVIVIKEFVSTAFNFIPPTPTKLGLYKKSIPEIFVDTSYNVPQTVIKGHDGSITISYGDFRDQILLEFEKRVYNNLKIEYDESILNIDSKFGGYYKNSLFDKNDVDNILKAEYLNWISDTDIDYTNNLYFDEFDSFTYTYSTMADIPGTSKLPGWWRGVYNWFYDTDAPHLRPWEMLGFTIKPTWWDEEYGPAPYTAGNLILWEDIRDGIIRQGPRQNLNGIPRYARKTIFDHLPVTDEGDLLSPLESNLATNFSLALSNRPFIFGDWSPSETAWRKSSELPFSILTTLVLLNPCEVITKTFDRTSIKRNLIGQIVNKTTNKFFTTKDYVRDTYLKSENLFGTVNYVVASLQFQSKAVTTISNVLSNIDIRLSNRLSGFVDKTQFKYLLDSRTPQSTSSSIFVPPENFDIIFNISSPIQSVVYSGVIIEKREDGWKIYGYDKLNPTFKYFDTIPTNSDYLIRVGGVSENFLTWFPNQFYGKGTLIINGNKYYRANVNHTSAATFDTTLWQPISTLPIVGGIEAYNRNTFDTADPLELPYGSVLTTIQEIADFLFGYGAYLQSQGIVFDQYDEELQISRDWNTSVKEFLYWTTHNWEVGSILTLSPGASELKILIPLGTVDNLLDSFYDYSILKSDGTKLSSIYLDVNRDFQTFVLGTYDTPDGVYFARVNFVVKEHVAIFNNRTVFNDVIYDPEPGYRQERIKIVGYRTIEWDGDYTVPGFLFDDANIQSWQPFTDYKLGDIVRYKDLYYTSKSFQQGSLKFNFDNWTKTDQLPTQGLVTNFDYRINQFDDYYDLDASGVQTSQRDLARHAIGYQPRQYLENIAQDEVSQYKLFQGFIKEKGTANAITKIFDKLTRSNNSGIILNEEWAFRVGKFGGVDQVKEYEFTLEKSNFKLNPQPVLFFDGVITNTLVDNYIRLNDTHFTQYPEKFSTSVIPTSIFDSTTRSAGFVKPSDVDFIVKNRDEILTLDISKFLNNSTVWVTFDNNSWTVLRFKLSSIIIDSVKKESNTVVITTEQYHNINVGDIIGINNVENLTGFFKVASIDLGQIVVEYSRTDDVQITDSAFVPVGVFEPARFSTTEELDLNKFAKLPNDSKLWIDETGGAGWAVLNRTKQFSSIPVEDYGPADPSNLGTAVAYAETADKIVASMPGATTVGVFVKGNVEGLTPSQLLIPPVGFETSFDGKFGDSLAVSSDGRFIIIGVPRASAVPSFYSGEYQVSADYNEGSVVRQDGKLWRAKEFINGDGGTISLSNNKWDPVLLNTGFGAAPALAPDAIYTNQGAIAVFENTENFGNYKGIWNSTTLYFEGDVVNRNGYFYRLAESTSTAREITSIGEDPSDPASTFTSGLEINPRVWQTIGAVNQWFFSNIIISPQPFNNEFFGSEISINGANGTYWMTVTAKGNGTSVKARVYLYKFSNGQWQQLEDAFYQGVYDDDRSNTVFDQDSVVFYGNSFYRAKSSVPIGTLPTNTTFWTPVSSYSDQGFLPTNPAINDINSSVLGYVEKLEAGYTQGIVEDVNLSNGFGESVDISVSGSILVVGAPTGTGYYFPTYRGQWAHYQRYTVNDVVLYEGYYYRLTTPSSGPFNDPDYVFPSGPFQQIISPQTTTGGKVFVYKKNDLDVFVCVQVINNITLPDIKITNENTTQLTNEDLIRASDNFGTKVKLSLDGTKLFVSAPNADVDGQDKGRVYIFEFNNAENKFKLVQAILSPSDVFNEKFGSSLAVSKTGKTLAVGALNGRTESIITFDDNTTTFDLTSTRFFDSVGTTGTVWSYDFIDTQYVLGEEIAVSDVESNESFGRSLACSDTVIAVGSPFYINTINNRPIGRIFRFNRLAGATSWARYEVQQPLADINLLKSLFVFDPITEKKINDIDIVDPFKLKIIGIADQEIKYKTPYDPAIYRVGTADSRVDESIAWQEDHIGEVWWDISTAKWPWYEQGDNAFRIGNWGKLAYGASVDVYEWVETIYTPSEWLELSGTADGLAAGISGTPYISDDSTVSFKQVVDSITGLVSTTFYYFWVKNKLAAPEGIESRKISVSEIARLIREPETTGIPFVGLISSSSLICYNIDPLINTKTIRVNLQFNKTAKDINLEHREYHLLTEGVADSLPTPQIENKWIDSLIGVDSQGNAVPDSNLPTSKRYGISFRPRQGMFVDRQAALTVITNNVNTILNTKPFADTINFENLNLVDTAPNVLTRLYDLVVDSEIDLNSVGTAKLKPAVLRANIRNGVIVSVTVVDPGYGYKYPPVIEIRGNGTGATVEVSASLIDPDTKKLTDTRGRITSVTVTNGGRRYTTASVIPRSFAVLVNPQGSWSIYTFDENIKQFFRSRTQAFDTTKYWSRVDWWKEGYSENSRIYATVGDLYEETEFELAEGQLLKVEEYGNGGWAILEKVSLTDADILNKYRLVGKQNGTIQIDTAIANSVKNKSGYDAETFYDNTVYDQQPTTEIRNILRAVKENIFVDDLRVEWNKLFFTSIHYILSEQVYVDWVFKTSFLNAIHNVGNLVKKPNYQNDNLESYNQYVEEVKPYRTKVREFTSRYQADDNTRTATTDFDLPAVYNPDTNKIEPVNGFSNLINTYPWKSWTDNNTYKVIELRIVDGGSDYSTAPVITIEGGGGSGATAKAYIRAGKVTAVELLTSGQGYTSAPTVVVTGGNGSNVLGTAKIVAVIGQGLVRSMNVEMKFDRYSKDGRFNSTTVTETFTGTGAKTVFELLYPPSMDQDFVEVSVDGNQALRSDYKASMYASFVNGKEFTKGKLVFATAPISGSVISVTYEKNVEIFDSINRLANFYKPKAGMLGVGVNKDNSPDYSQLMTGLDFGGVIVQGTTFDVSGGWDALPWFTEGWDTTIPVFSDYYYVMPAPTLPITVTGALGTGITATLTFATQSSRPYVVGSFITVQNMNVSGYNGTFVVLACSTTSVSYANATIGDSIGGTVTGLLSVIQPVIPEINETITIYQKKRISTTHTGNGTTSIFEYPETVDAPIVYVTVGGNKVQKFIDIDYFIADKKIRFFANKIPPSASIITIDTYNAPIRIDGVGNKMPTFIGDGSTAAITIPITASFGQDDIFIFRPLDSDGSLAIVDKNLLDADVSGGIFGPYITANGTTPEEIVIEGSTFVSPDQVPAPEENIPGQVLESVSIKVFHSTTTGAPIMVTRVYTTNGTTATFDIGQSVFEPSNLFVLLDGERKDFEQDFIIDFINKKITFLSVPANNLLVEIKSLGIAGGGIVDYEEFTGDGTTRFFLTKASFDLTADVVATVNGVDTPISFKNSNGVVNDADLVFVEFGSAPPLGAVIKIVSVNSSTSLVRVNSQEFTVVAGQRNYTLSGFVSTTGPIRSNVIVDLAGETLLPPDSTVAVYTGSNNILKIGVDPFLSGGSISIEDISVYINDSPISFIVDWTFDTVNKSVIIRQSKLTVGDRMLVELSNSSEYSIASNVITLSNSLTLINGQKLTVTWFENYKNMQLVRDVFTGGKSSYKLQTIPLSISYIWVYKNGISLTQDIDFELDDSRTVVRLKDNTTDNDVIQIISFGNNALTPPVTFEMFKDMLNRNHFKRGPVTGLKLVKDLRYYDTEIQISNPALIENTNSGIIVINSERIGFETRNGNFLGQLRRGLFGTAIPEVHARNSLIVNVSDSESLPYSDIQTKFDFYADGATKEFGPLPFIPPKRTITNWYRNTIPSTHGQCDTIEVFVAGQRQIKAPINVYNETLGLYSPATGDSLIEAEFSVNGTTAFVRLTSAPPAGTRITVVQRQGKTWFEPANDGLPLALTSSNSDVARFIRDRSTLVPNFIKASTDILNTESGDTIDDENDNPLEI
ncbi:hypothetical protein EBU71_01325 [bacterium]|nr:hypothetical protein [Candidatus Elulimicrobium humile]